MRRVFGFVSVAILVVASMSAPSALRCQVAQPQSSKTDEQPLVVHDGFITGQQFRGLPEPSKRSYAAGLVDGVLLAPLMGAPKARMKWLESCLVGMTDEQVAAIIVKFVNDNPARWHEPVHVQFFSAMRSACPRAP